MREVRVNLPVDLVDVDLAERGSEPTSPTPEGKLDENSFSEALPGRFPVKCGAWTLGATLMAGIAFGLIILVNSMQTNDTEFLGGTENAGKEPIVGEEGSPFDPCGTADCFSLEEVALHSTSTDCWIVYHGNVYDMTEYAPHHEGGENLITNGCGTDQTSLFTRFHNETELRLVEHQLLGTVSVVQVEMLSRPEHSSSSEDTSLDGSIDAESDAPAPHPIGTPAPDDTKNEAPSGAPTTVDNMQEYCPSGNCVPSQELVLHNVEEDCWVVYLGNAYDMTDYIPMHKGGPNFITNACGTDGTEGFLNFHKEKELKKVKDNLIGPYLAISDNPGVTLDPTAAPVEHSTDSPISGPTSTEHPSPQPSGSSTVSPTAISACPTGNCVTSEELVLHNLEEDCWVVYLGNAYDMTDYIPQHKGGPNFITNACGTDGTEGFLNFHKEKELKKVKDNLIGPYLVISDNPGVTLDPTAAPVEHATDSPISGPTSTEHPSPQPSGSPTVSPTAIPACPTGNCVTSQELVLHNLEEDCWVVYLGNAYDMTEYIPQHKGGPSFITNACGTDGTEGFLNFHKEKELKKVEDNMVGPYVEILLDTVAPTNTSMSTGSPTASPTAAPSVYPTSLPLEDSKVPTLVPTELSSTGWPTDEPTEDPTASPTEATTEQRTVAPTRMPTRLPTRAPTMPPTQTPTDGPTKSPTKSPTMRPTPRPTDAPTEAPVTLGVTMEELSRHNSIDDCWAAYLGNVYDMAEFVSEHKGGPVFITQACGKDGTDAFLAYHQEKELKKVEDKMMGPLV